jgi:hypothetical protein
MAADARLRLRSAVAAIGICRGKLDDAKGFMLRAQDLVNEAAADLAEKIEAKRTAEASAADNVIVHLKAARQGAQELSGASAAAMAAAEAEQRHEVVKRALATLQSELTEAQEAVTASQRAAHDCAYEVVRAEVADLLGKLETANRRRQVLRAAISSFSTVAYTTNATHAAPIFLPLRGRMDAAMRDVEPDSIEAVTDAQNSANAAIFGGLSGHPVLTIARAELLPPPPNWAAFVEQLLVDPDAQLFPTEASVERGEAA